MKFPNHPPSLSSNLLLKLTLLALIGHGGNMSFLFKSHLHFKELLDNSLRNLGLKL